MFHFVKTINFKLLQAWPEDALEKVARRYLTGVNISDEVKDSAVSVCKFFHVVAR